jgi:Zn-dependent peptidase ImmA (M78 family)
LLSAETSVGPVRPPVAALLKAQAETLDADSRFSVAESATVGRQIRELHDLLGRQSRWDDVVRFVDNDDYRHPSEGTPERLARQVRQSLDLGEGPITSVKTDLLERLGIVSLWDWLPPDIDAFSMATPETGAIVVSNIAGRHMSNAFGRRIAWAHEVCHVLFDRSQMRDLRKFCTVVRQGPVRSDSRYDVIERRARAFAAYLLAPRASFIEFWNQTQDDPRERRIRRVMERFGIGYEATRSHLDNLKLLGIRVRVDLVPTTVPQDWGAADPARPRPVELAEAGVAHLRSGVLYDLVHDALADQRISEGAAREALRIRAPQWERLRPLIDETNSVGGSWRSSAALLSDWL